MDILVYLMMGLFIAYPIFVIKEFGVLSSISKSSYKLEPPKNYIYFTGWLGSLGVLTAIQSAFDPSMAVFFALMCMGFAYSGVTVEHGSDPKSGEDEYHTYGTILIVVAGLGGLWTVHGIWEPLVATGIGGFLIKKLWPKTWIFWAEVLAGLAVAVGLLMR